MNHTDLRTLNSVHTPDYTIDQLYAWKLFCIFNWNLKRNKKIMKINEFLKSLTNSVHDSKSVRSLLQCNIPNKNHLIPYFKFSNLAFWLSKVTTSKTNPFSIDTSPACNVMFCFLFLFNLYFDFFYHFWKVSEANSMNTILLILIHESDQIEGGYGN